MDLGKAVERKEELVGLRKNFSLNRCDYLEKYVYYLYMESTEKYKE